MTVEFLRSFPLRSLLVLTGVALPSLSMAQEPGDLPGLTGNMEKGERRYIEFQCYACHGYTGETGNAPNLNPLRFNQPAFIAYVRSPSRRDRGFQPGSIMPPYAGADVSDQDLVDIYTWLSSLPSTVLPVEDNPLLKDL